MAYSNCCNAFVEEIPEHDICPSCEQEATFTTVEKVLAKETFITPPRNRKVTVRVFHEHISFHFTEEGDREFYWFDKHQWLNDRNQWEEHMGQKNWFTSEMLDFINQHTKTINQ